MPDPHADRRQINQLVREAAAPKRPAETPAEREARLKQLVAAYAATYSEFRYRLAVTEGLTDEAAVRARFIAVTRRIDPA